MKNFLKYLNSIKTKLIFSCLVITLTPLIYISYTMLTNATDELLKVIVSNSLAHARKTTIDINTFIGHQLEILKPILTDYKKLDPKSEEFKKIIVELDNHYLSIEKIIVRNKFGQLINYSNNSFVAPYVNVSKIYEKLANKDFILDNGHNHLGKKYQNSISLIFKVNESNPDDVALVFIELNMLQFTNILSDNVVGNSTNAYILDDKNYPVIYYPENGTASHISMMKDKYIEKFDYGVFNINSTKLKKPVLATYLPIVGLNGWKILFVQNQEEVYELVRSFRKDLYIILFITIVIAVVIALLISQNIAFPILQVTNGTNELASGRYDVRINIDSSDEVGRLANNFNFMADSLSTKM